MKENKRDKVSSDAINSLIERLEFVFTQIAPTRIHCAANLGDFTVADGFAKPVLAENFNEADGMAIAKENALAAAENKLWENEGWRLFVEKNPEFDTVPAVRLPVRAVYIEDVDNLPNDVSGAVFSKVNKKTVKVEGDNDQLHTCTIGDYVFVKSDGTIAICAEKTPPVDEFTAQDTEQPTA